MFFSEMYELCTKIESETKLESKLENYKWQSWKGGEGVLFCACVPDPVVKKLFLLVLGILIMITIPGCATGGKMDKILIPGNPLLNDYGTNFEIDWKVYDSGTYTYGPEGSTVRRLGGGREGYKRFYILTMDFSFKDGSRYHEKIDIRRLIEEMVKIHDVYDLSKARLSGYVSLNIRIERNQLVIDYELNEMTEKSPKRVLYKRYYYPVFEKRLIKVSEE